jgi:hypothetical protein
MKQIIDPIGTHGQIKPVGFWSISMNLAFAEYN